MLLALNPAARASEVCYLDTRCLSKKEKLRGPIKYIPFDTNKNLCVFHDVGMSLQKTKEWLKAEAQLLLSFIVPHQHQHQ